MTRNTFSDKKLSERLDSLIEQAIAKAVEAHRQKGESIAISDERGKVKIIPAHEIAEFKKDLDDRKLAK